MVKELEGVVSNLSYPAISMFCVQQNWMEEMKMEEKDFDVVQYLTARPEGVVVYDTGKFNAGVLNLRPRYCRISLTGVKIPLASLDSVTPSHGVREEHGLLRIFNTKVLVKELGPLEWRLQSGPGVAAFSPDSAFANGSLCSFLHTILSDVLPMYKSMGMVPLGALFLVTIEGTDDQSAHRDDDRAVVVNADPKRAPHEFDPVWVAANPK